MMKKYILFYFSLLISAASCNVTDVPAVSTLRSSNLKSNFVKLKAGNAYTLKTPKGAVLRIAKNTFSKNAADEVLLEIKEAYTLNDMITGGLVTESNGKLLNSGGMIYINATINGKEAEVLKPFKASIPTTAYNDSMQLFKGEITADSSINWTSPEPIDTTSEFRNRLILGRNLSKNCVSCHKPTQDFTGPALAGVRLRAPYPEWPYLFTTNPIKMIKTDRYTKEVYEKWRGNGIMSAFPMLSKDDVKAIFDYCDNEAALNPVQLPANTADTLSRTTAAPPCETVDTIYTRPAKYDIEAITYNGTEDIPPYQPADITPSLSPSPATSTEGLRGGFTDPNDTNGMYDFKVKTLGWYNVDAFVEGYKGSSLVTLKVKILQEVKNRVDMHIYVFCPDKKMLSVANNFDGENHFFDKIEGKVPLFLNDKAIIIAFTSRGNELLYGISSFNIQQQQLISISLKSSTPEAFRLLIQQNKIEGIELDVIKKEDIEIIKKPCDEILADTAKVVWNK